MRKLPFILPAVFLASLLLGCARYHNSVISYKENPRAYYRLAGIVSKLLPLMDVASKDKYRIIVIEDDTLNAYAAEYTIVIFSGLLNGFGDDELTCIVAHEIAHISLGHYSKQLRVSSSKSQVFSELPDAGLLSSIFKPAAIKAYSRQQEIEADMEVVRVARNVGISPEVYIAALSKLKDPESEGEGGGIFDTHPSVSERIERIREAIREQ